MANTKLSEEEWKEKRADTKLGLESMVQGIRQLEDLGVLTGIEKIDLTGTRSFLEGLIHRFILRTQASKEEYCDTE